MNRSHLTTVVRGAGAVFLSVILGLLAIATVFGALLFGLVRAAGAVKR